MINHVVLMLKFFYWHLHDNIFVQNKRICSNQTTFVTFGSYFQSHNRNLSLWSYSWIKPLSSRFVVPIPVSWFSLADFGELNPYTGHVRCEMTLLHWIPAPCDAYLIWRNILSVTYLKTKEIKIFHEERCTNIKIAMAILSDIHSLIKLKV